MAESESSPGSGIVAILAILLMIVIAGFIAWRAGVFGGSDHAALEIDVNAPSSSR